MEAAILYLDTTCDLFKEKVKNLVSKAQINVKECKVPHKWANPLDPLYGFIPNRVKAIVLVLPGTPRHYGIIIKYLKELCTEVGADFKKVLQKHVTILINVEGDFDSLKSVLIGEIEKTKNNFVVDNIHKWSDKNNESNEKAEKAIQELAKISESITGKTFSVIAVGNPGVGKSLFLNILLGEHVFKSGISIGKGKCIFLENSLTYLLISS